MKLFRFALNIWITLASVLSFLLGWVALAHSPKPVQPAQVQIVSPAALPTLIPLQDLQSGVSTDNGVQTFQVQPSTSYFNSAPAPVFRSSGS